MLVNLGIIFLVCVVIAFIYIIKVIARDFDAPIKATKNYLQPKIKEVINSDEPIKNLEKPYSRPIAVYILGVVFLSMFFNLIGLESISIILLVLAVIPLVAFSACPYRNKIEIGDIRFMSCFALTLLLWGCLIFFDRDNLFIFCALYGLGITLAYYCCMHTYISWFFVLVFWFGPLALLPFLDFLPTISHKYDRGNDYLIIGHVVLFLPISFISLRVLVEFYYWFKNKQIKSSKNA